MKNRKILAVLSHVFWGLLDLFQIIILSTFPVLTIIKIIQEDTVWALAYSSIFGIHLYMLIIDKLELRMASTLRELNKELDKALLNYRDDSKR